jgi:hypothetical protein
MLPRRAVTAAYVAAAQAQPEVNPTAAGLEALLTAVRCMWHDWVELWNVGTALGHKPLSMTVDFTTSASYSQALEPMCSGRIPLTHQGKLI